MAMARMIGGPIVTAPMANPRRSGFYDVKCGRDQALNAWSDIDEYSIWQHRIV